MNPNTRIVNRQQGFVVYADTAAHTGTWEALNVIADAKFHTLSGSLATGAAHTTAGSAMTWPAGSWLYGNFTAIQLHSGTVVAYQIAR